MCKERAPLPLKVGRIFVAASVYVIGLHAVQFGNNWIQKNSSECQIGLGLRPRPRPTLKMSDGLGRE